MDVCSKCQNTFSCSLNKSCWCSTYPKLQHIESKQFCLCPSCLQTQLNLELKDKIDELGAQKGSLIQFVQESESSDNLIEGLHYYWEGPYMVFTERYHLKRGTCCGSGCRHCPYKNF